MSTPTADTAEELAPESTRRCWRCLQMFPCDASDLHTGPAQWWLCDPCHQSLIGPAR
jgi:hypothetical protein